MGRGRVPLSWAEGPFPLPLLLPTFCCCSAASTTTTYGYLLLRALFLLLLQLLLQLPREIRLITDFCNMSCPGACSSWSRVSPTSV